VPLIASLSAAGGAIRANLGDMMRTVPVSVLFCFLGSFAAVPAAWAQPPRGKGADPEENFRIQREHLIENVLIPGGVSNKRVLESSRTTLRHKFVPKQHHDKAYQDIAIAIGGNQTISSPYIVALMTQELDPQPIDKVLEIGTGSGYQAAILSPLVKDVYTIEIVEELGVKTKKLLEDLSYKNVHCLIGDGYKGWPEHAPFDKIIVTCSPEKVPQPLQEQLKEGGIMIIPVGERYQQMLYRMRKVNGMLEQESLQPTLFVPMTGVAEDNREIAPDPANPKLLNSSFEDDVIKDSHVPGWYYQFGCTVTNDGGQPEGRRAVEFRSQDSEQPSMLLQGIALDGRHVKKIRMGGWIRTEDVSIVGSDKTRAPAVAIQYFDEKRNRIGYNYVGGIQGTNAWKKYVDEFKVPALTREAIVSVGLFGATGMAQFDGLIFEPIKK
jgi:protein-L-isoaspartate(D-aspartate) O-methyltransferase